MKYHERYFVDQGYVIVSSREDLPAELKQFSPSEGGQIDTEHKFIVLEVGESGDSDMIELCYLYARLEHFIMGPKGHLSKVQLDALCIYLYERSRDTMGKTKPALKELSRHKAFKRNYTRGSSKEEADALMRHIMEVI